MPCVKFRTVAFIWDSNDAPPSSILSAQAIVTGGPTIPGVEHLQSIHKVLSDQFQSRESLIPQPFPAVLPEHEALN